MKLYLILIGILTCCLAQAGNAIPMSLGKNSYVDSLKIELHKDVHDTIRMRILHLLAADLLMTKPFESLVYAREGLKLAKIMGRKNTQATMYNLIGLSYEYIGNYSKAIDSYLKALHMIDKDPGAPQNIKAAILINIGIYYLHFQQADLGERYLKEAQKLNNGNAIELYINLGCIEKARGNNDEAIAYYKKAMEYDRKNPALNINIGDVYASTHRFQEAVAHYKIALEAKAVQYKIYSYIGLGTLYLKMNHLSRALFYLDRGRKIAESQGIILHYRVVYALMSDVYRQQRNFEKADKYNLEFHKLKDSIFNEQNAAKINALQHSYDLQKRDNQIQLLNKDRVIAETSIEKERTYRNLLIAIILFVLITGVVLYRNIVLRQRMKNKVLSEEKALIELEKKQVDNDIIKLLRENTEARYEMLKSKTNPHFLFNSMNTLISLVYTDRDKAVEFIECFSDLYRSILTTGKRKVISLRQEMVFVNQFLYLQKLRFKDKLVIEVDIAEELYDSLVPPFAIQMIVENAIKHNTISHSHHLIIAITTGNNDITIKNNLKKKTENVVSTYTGQKSITDRYHLLSDQKPVFTKTETEYLATLPLMEKHQLAIE